MKANTRTRGLLKFWEKDLRWVSWRAASEIDRELDRVQRDGIQHYVQTDAGAYLLART